ncbi:MAG: MaoC family dehydratase N-terminal domain-containing protein, partial [Pseudomonadales bacterium]|nr:MaoC family dehydratase N-terminal domain-containing protein [Pseudomonadales bacterium]
MDTSLIGQKSTPKIIVAEQGQMQFFAKVTGARNRIYWDVEAARAAGHPALPAPPTFLFSLDLLAPSG